MMATETQRAHRISVISGKGGVGKTVITANLAVALQSIGRRVLVVDADLGLANLDVLLGIAPELTIQDLLFGSHSLEEVLVKTRKGFDLLPAGSGLPEGTVFTPALGKKMNSILERLEKRYDAILFDAGAGIGDVVLFFANLADDILLVVTPEPTSMMDSYAAIKVLNQLYGRTEFLLIINQANPACPEQIGASVVGHLQNIVSRFIGCGRDGHVRLELAGSIPTDPAIPRAISEKQLLAESSPHAPSTLLMNHLAAVLHSRL
jgi:flagellar biosynthesis protein FlhG